MQVSDKVHSVLDTLRKSLMCKALCRPEVQMRGLCNNLKQS